MKHFCISLLTDGEMGCFFIARKVVLFQKTGLFQGFYGFRDMGLDQTQDFNNICGSIILGIVNKKLEQCSTMLKGSQLESWLFYGNRM